MVKIQYSICDNCKTQSEEYNNKKELKKQEWEVGDDYDICNECMVFYDNIHEILHGYRTTTKLVKVVLQDKPTNDPRSLDILDYEPEKETKNDEYIQTYHPIEYDIQCRFYKQIQDGGRNKGKICEVGYNITEDDQKKTIMSRIAYHETNHHTKVYEELIEKFGKIAPTRPSQK